jgi:hypothetical protein
MCVSSDQEAKVTPLTSKVDSILSLHIPHIPLTIKDVFLDWAWKLKALRMIKKNKIVLRFFTFKKIINRCHIVLFKINKYSFFITNSKLLKKKFSR